MKINVGDLKAEVGSFFSGNGLQTGCDQLTRQRSFHNIEIKIKPLQDLLRKPKLLGKKNDINLESWFQTQSKIILGLISLKK